MLHSTQRVCSLQSFAMFPRLPQRMFIGVTMVLGGLVWLSAKQFLSAQDGSGGISLLSAQIGPVGAMALVLAASVPTVVMSVLVSARGNPLAGIFAASATLGVLAVDGGAMIDWIRMQDEADALPSAYGGLILETLFWQLPLVVLIITIGKARDSVRRRWPILSSDKHCGTEPPWSLPNLQAIGGGLLCALVSGVLCFLILRVGDTKQVIVSLLIVFTIGGLMGQMVFPQPNPIAILLSPMIVAVAGYAYVQVKFNSSGQTLAAIWDMTLRGPPLALPIHFASAAVAGSSVGIGWAQVIVQSNQEIVVEDAAESKRPAKM